MGRRRKKKTPVSQEDEGSTVPRTFVMHRGEVGKSVMCLENDLRHIMEPYTAVNLKVRKNNVLKDFVHVAGPLGVTHFMILSKTEVGTYLRFTRIPRGPTLVFKIHEYSLAKDVISLLKRPKTFGSQYKKPPLLVLNGFNTETLPMKLMTTMFQNIFPSINIQKVHLGDIRRCVLLNYDPETKLIDFRHYNIQVVPVGMSRGVKKLIQTKLPNLSKLDDISDYVLGGGCGYGSESEGEEPVDGNVTLPQNVPGRGNIKSQKSAIRLTEMGPRLVIQLVKIEDGLCSGEVLYHEYITKTEAEKRALKERREKKRKLKEMRKKIQEENVKRKEKEKELNRERSIAGQKRKQASEKSDDIEEEEIDQPKSKGEDDEEDFDADDDEVDDDDDDDDTYWYRKEVGAEPDADLILTNKSKAKNPSVRRAMKRKSEDKNEAGIIKKSRKDKTINENEKKGKKLLRKGGEKFDGKKPRVKSTLKGKFKRKKR